MKLLSLPSDFLFHYCSGNRNTKILTFVQKSYIYHMNSHIYLKRKSDVLLLQSAH